MKKTILGTACVLGMLAVVFGAFGAHGLKKLVDENAIGTFETGVRYQMYHAFFLFVLALLPDTLVRTKTLIYSCIVIGVVLFSFSIYLLALNGLVGFDSSVVGMVTPIGGVFLIAGWVLLGYRLVRANGSK